MKALLSPIEALSHPSLWWELWLRNPDWDVIGILRSLEFGHEASLAHERLRFVVRAPGELGVLINPSYQWPKSLTDRLSAVFEIAIVASHLVVQNRALQFDFSIGPGLDVGDGGRPSLVFSSQRAEDFLVPDFEFLLSNRYESFFKAAAARSRKSRISQAYWRGTVNSQDRVDLIRWTRGCPEFDVRGTSNSDWDVYRNAFRGMIGLTEDDVQAPREPISRVLDFATQIHVDGIAAAYKSLFIKLISGQNLVILKKSKPYQSWLDQYLQPFVGSWVHLPEYSQGAFREAARIAIDDSHADKHEGPRASRALAWELRGQPLSAFLDGIESWDGLFSLSSLATTPLIDRGSSVIQDLERLFQTCLEGQALGRIRRNRLFQSRLEGSQTEFLECYADLFLAHGERNTARRLLRSSEGSVSFTHTKVSNGLD